MAKKKKTTTPSFSAGSFRQFESAGMPTITSIPQVDERTQLAAKGIIPKPAVTQEIVTPTPQRYYNYYTDPYYTRNPITGLSPAQMEAQAGLKEALDARTAIGLGGTLVQSPRSAGKITTTPVKIGTQPTGKKVVSTYTDPNTGDVIAIYDDGTTGIISKGTKGADAAAKAAADALAAKQAADLAAEEKRKAGQSAYTLLLEQFNQYGLGGLIEPLKGFITEGLSPAEFTLRLRETDAYKKRFAANAQRVAKGLRALSEAEYIGLEDQYQDVMRRYGLPESYYTRGDMGRQEGFEKFIAGDVSPVELEDRVQVAQRRVLNAAPQIKDTLMAYYGGDITNGDILAYVLDPSKAIENIKRKVTAAEIGGAASRFGLGATRSRAEELGQYGVTGEQAQQGFQTISEVLPRGSQLAEFYKQTPYTQETVESEVFALPGSTEAAKQRKKITQLEQASFAGSSGIAQGALARDRAGAF